jgi:hypothetical protein
LCYDRFLRAWYGADVFQAYEIFDMIALVLVYTAVTSSGSYTLAIRRAQAARRQNQALPVNPARETNNPGYTAQLGQLAVSRAQLPARPA